MDKFFEVSPISGIWCSGRWCGIYKRILCTFIFYLFFAACNHKTLNGIVITSCSIENRIGVVLKKGQTLETLFEERSKLYEQYADIEVSEEGLDVEQTVEKLVEALEL